MHRVLATTCLALVALAALASSAFGATKKPTVTSFSPAQVPVGTLLTIKGKNFLAKAGKTTVFFTRASDGKTVRAHAKTASKTKITVIVPSTITKFLDKDSAGAVQATRFQLAIFSKVLGSKTKASKSPFILPAGSAPATGTPGTPGAPATPAVPVADCDADGTPDAADPDDDNDGLSDDLENTIHTNICNPDSDGDKVNDAYEYYASLDMNNNPTYAGKRPYPNPLDKSDAGNDFDGDGMTMLEEYNASVAFGTATTAPLTYSDGNQTSVAAGNSGAMDLDENGRITDEEKDADNDGLPNWLELAKKEPSDPNGVPTGACKYVPSDNGSGYGFYVNIFTNCGSGPMANGNTFTGPVGGKLITGSLVPAWDPNPLNYLDADSDGDGVTDGADDQDFDRISNLEEIQKGTDNLLSSPQDPCDPNPDSPTCPTHGSHNP